MRYLKAFAMCLSTFTAIPCPWPVWDEDARPLMPAFLPTTGLLIGALWLAAAYLTAGWPPLIGAFVIAALPALLTGFIHLDGFMDTVDAVRSYRSVEERRRILKDPHCGAFAVIALGLLLMAQFAAACEMRGGGLRALLLLPALSRCLSALAVCSLAPISHSQYAGRGNQTGLQLCVLAQLLAVLLAAWRWAGARALAALLAAAAVYALAMARAVRSLGGVSGDLAGYALCLCECAGLMAAAVL